MHVTKDMRIIEVINAHPEARVVLAQHGLGGCMMCMGATSESLENGAREHGINLEALLKDLNALFK